MLHKFHDPESVLEILELRSVKDKVGISVPADDRHLFALNEMVNKGLLTWIDRAYVTPSWILCDIYLLTDSGIELCDELEIEQH